VANWSWWVCIGYHLCVWCLRWSTVVLPPVGCHDPVTQLLSGAIVTGCSALSLLPEASADSAQCFDTFSHPVPV
jgi:hypothetical protein